MKRIVVASCDAKFCPLARDLFASIWQTSNDTVDEILFFDLGLSADQRLELSKTPGIRIIDYPASLTSESYADFLTPRMFAWKTYALREAALHSPGAAILYMDCGCIVLNSLRPIFDHIERDDVFLVQDPHRNDERTHEDCFSIMQATPAERTAPQIDAGAIGFRAGGKFSPLFEQGFQFAKNRACIFGDASVHRHDQSIYSILAARHGITPMHRYGKEVHWQGIQTRDQIIWQHRGKWPAFRRLQERASTNTPRQRIALYGAGKHTERFLTTLHNLLEPRHQIVGILDDAPSVTSIGGMKVVATDNWKSLTPDVILVSSDAHEAAMIERGRQAFPGANVWGIYSA